MNNIETVCETDGETRIDVFAAGAAGVTRSRAAALVSEGLVSVNGKTVSKSCKVKNSLRPQGIRYCSRKYTA